MIRGIAISLTVSLVVASLGAVADASAQTSRLRDDHGRSETRDGTTRFYDERRRAKGRAERRGSTTRFYDQRGRSTGRSEDRGGTTRFYDQRGRSTGRSTTR